MNAIILCGGLSTRLGEITKSAPKVLLDIKGKTVLDWQLEKLREFGIKEVVLAAGHLSDILKKEVGANRNGIKIIYAVEKEKLGTGGAIKFAWNNFVSRPEEPVVILNGDILAKAKLSDMAGCLRPESEGNILGSKVEDASPYGTLKFDANRHLLSFKEKEGKKQAGYINGGIYIFTSAVKKYFPKQNAFSVEYDVFPKMKNLDVYPSDDAWVDIGVPERLEWARKFWD